MMKGSTLALLLFFLVLINPFAFAQDEPRFSSDPAQFTAELEFLFRQAPARQRQASATLISNIRQAFNTGMISVNHQQAMVQAANKMNDFRLKAFPYFFAYFSSAMSYHAKADLNDRFSAWNSNVIKLAERGNEKNLLRFLEQSELFFKEGYLYHSNTLQWRYYGGTWSLVSDSIPVFVISDATLTCYATRDSLNLFNVSGAFDPLNSLWSGTKGRITWGRAGLSETAVYADFANHQIQLSSSEYTIDSAWLRYPDYFNFPLHGRISDRVVAGAVTSTRTYPRFTSYQILLEVKNVFPGIDYAGGFALEGSRVLGFGQNRENAHLIFRKNGEEIIRLTSHNFVIREDRITSQRAAFCLYVENDSIYHPGLQIRYLHQERELMALRAGEGLAQSPFFNSYHHLDMLFEALYWKMGEEIITLGAMRGIGRESLATFESANFFTTARFNRIQGMDARHPLIVINDFIKGLNSNVFYHEELAVHMNIELSQVSALLITLANHGFLQYSPDDGRVVIKDRLEHYIESVNNRSDYDVIRIQSKVDGLINAKLDLANFDLEIFGVPEVNLSSIQRVFVYPFNSRISMKKDLDFVFMGQIHAGYFEFYAQECSFLYDDFKLHLAQIDSLSFKVPVQDEKKMREELERVRTVISNISGDLLIDHPSNKSGRKTYPRYPIFDSKNDSYVYFDENHIQNGVYTRDKFYYHILPFTIDSLTNFTTIGMSFNGYLHSGNIFPDIEEPLRVQPDYSLGFVKSFTEEGLPLYEEKAQAFVEISLSHQGLRGGGRIEYLTSTMYSDDFVFHPDSMMAKLHEFDLEASIGNISHPAVYANDVTQKWIIDDNSMILRSATNIPFEMYDKQLSLKGSLIYRPDGLFGSGELTYADAAFRSTNFGFRHNVFGADKSVFILSSPAFGTAFSATSFGFTYDLDLRQGLFEKHGNHAWIEFPLNQYLAYMDAFRWETDFEEIHLSLDDALPMLDINELSNDKRPAFESRKPNFISQHSDQDSLRFAAGAARFDLREYAIDIQEVPYISVADAALIPIDGHVGVLRNAEMKPLVGAKLLANLDTRYHDLYNVTATIYSRNDYSATGVYDYTDNSGKTQTVYFNRIAVDSTGNSFGLAHISDLGFSLDPYFDFIGNIRFVAHSPDFYFDGGFRIRHDCSEANPRWVRFQGEVDKHRVVLPVNQPAYDVHGEKLTASLLFSTTANKVYSGFLLGRQFATDDALISSHGAIYYEPSENAYIIENSTDPVDPDLRAKYLKLDIDRCVISGEGVVSFGHNLGRVVMQNSGIIDHYLLPDSTIFRLFTTIDFFFDNNLLEFLNKSLAEASLSGLNPNTAFFSRGLHRLLPEVEAQNAFAELNTFGAFRRFPSELSQTMILSDVQMKWNPATRSFTSYGPIGIFTLNSRLVNRYVEGHIELVRRRAGDVLNIYFQTGDNEWYFFSYSAGVMQAISSSEEFNDVLLNLREDRRTLRTRGNEEPYQFIISTVQQRNAFLRRMRGN
jgi:hypothetical protein